MSNKVLTPEQVTQRTHLWYCSCGCEASDSDLQDSHEALRAQLAEAKGLPVAICHPDHLAVEQTKLCQSCYDQVARGLKAREEGRLVSLRQIKEEFGL